MKRALAACAALLTGASLALVPTAATAAPKPSAPGTIVINKVGPVVEYRYERLVDGEMVGRATVPITYTCYPVNPARPTMSMLVSIGHEFGTAWNSSYGDTFPCEGGKHRVDAPVSSFASAPVEPTDKQVRGTVRIFAAECVACNITVEPTTHSAPVKVKLIPAS